MNKQQLINELYRYHENELYMKNYYNRHKAFLPGELFPSDWSNSLVFFDSVFDLNANHTSKTASHTLPNDMIPESSMDVIITKHPRYGSVFEHDHSFFEILYVYDGTCQNSVDGHVLDLTKGDFCIIPPRVVHSIAVNSDSVILNFAILANTFKTTFSSLCRSNDFLSEYINSIIYSKKYQKYLLFKTGEDPILTDTILEIMLEQINRLPHRKQIINGLFIALCGYLLQRHENDISYPDEYYKDNNFVNLMTNFIVQNYNTVTLETLSKQFHMNSQYLSRFFTKETGKNFKTFITELRMEKAVRMLEETNLKVHDISSRIGYSNPNYFMRLFKKIYHCTPSEYRQSKAKVSELTTDSGK